ncbi:50S ribosomal protein L22 [bacterium (Candidatus Blackallbacteria) CG17_big_fil_post_rev_8_21_14_2_50_48_46]|uniref:Large ribosomal subunit protein uL22 n=1 Tax=bacterium (Candidatus Blackallbacteria) CG17_big_fil_post_rev_8_21_14_2_50_48_46 TaxID=2014261 RepID=A0A2M7G112_9BACT|nr:MAG: 50S ribosomal protein L22 [bacterium (Candidatus Blackallbacteria) CG18_big_fil_WC_8_21_14_2_50_49_26]PIW15398.1 MAG: 50S ribosomal protein L22 [bacterium (Candidatus Blackallbacteria) CG17_big_fil_post_rev_8_21_14_2_50_48_46]PIW49741.1 MAG: 50S ribosomal protein L22 [bacterium (Candidatus Blackallbacteria) CG13_big_fil_rev_8_21_14_2_50_49_14]
MSNPVKVKAIAKNVSMSPFKLRRVMNLVRGMNGLDALDHLKFMPHKAARIIEKVLHSALSNAENNNMLDVEELYVVEAFVDGGRTLRRVQPRAQGRAYMIKKRSSHVTIAVGPKKK